MAIFLILAMLSIQTASYFKTSYLPLKMVKKMRDKSYKALFCTKINGTFPHHKRPKPWKISNVMLASCVTQLEVQNDHSDRNINVLARLQTSVNRTSLKVQNLLQLCEPFIFIQSVQVGSSRFKLKLLGEMVVSTKFSTDISDKRLHG